jgi:autotransporter-associated beta strand protein
LLALAAGPAALAFFTNHSFGQTVTWDSSGTTPAAPVDGSGFWDTTTGVNWSNGGSDSAWTNGNVAAIGNGGTAGTITIDDGSGSVTAAGINFNAVGSGSYVVAGQGSDSLVFTGSGTINTASSTTSATISAPIAGTSGVILNGGGGISLSGNNSFTGGLTINNGSVTVASGGNLGASTNNVFLGTPAGTTVGTLAIADGITTTIGSLVNATNTAAATNTISIGNGSTLNINSALPSTGTGNTTATTNGVFLVGSTNLASAITTKLTVSGLGSLVVNGTTNGNNSSFIVGIGDANGSADLMTPIVDMSGLSNFSFTTGTGAFSPTVGGNSFLVGVGSGATATMTLAANNTIKAGTISLGDNSISTPGSGNHNGVNNASNANILNLGATNIFNTNLLQIGGGRSTGTLGWNNTVSPTGSLTLSGAAGGSSAAAIIVGKVNFGTPASSKSMLDLSAGTATIQSSTVTVGLLATGATGGKNTTVTGGAITFGNGTFNIASELDLAVVTGGTTTDSIGGTFNVGSGSSSNGVLTLGSAITPGVLHLANNNGSDANSAGAVGAFNVKGGTANIFANIIDVSTAGTSNTTVALTGGTLNMEGYAIGPKTAAGNTGAVGTRNLTTITYPSGTGTLMNLGGTGVNDAGLNMTGSGTLVLEGNNTYSGTTTVTTGAIQVGNTGDVTTPTAPFVASGATITDNGTLAFGSSLAMTQPGVIIGSGGFTQAGSGTTTLTATNLYSGVTNVTRGVLQIGDGGADGTIGTNTTGTMTVNGTLAFNRSDNAISIPNTIVGTGGIQQLGTGTSTISGANTYVGGTTVTNGSLVIQSPTALGFGGINTKAPPGTTVSANSSLDLAGQTVTQAITLNNGTLTNSSPTAANVGSGVLGVGVTSTNNVGFTGDASVTFSGAGTGASATAVLGLTAATFMITNPGLGYIGSSGNPAVTITGGGGTGATASAIVTQTIQLDGSTQGTVTGIKINSPGINYTSAPTIVIAAPTTGTQATALSNATNFILDGIQQTSAGSNYFTAPTATVTATAGSATLGTPVLSGVNLIGTGKVGGTGNITLAGVVTGPGALSKFGSDTVLLTAPNSYSGGTTVSSGVLIAGVTGALPTGTVNITGGSLQLAASTGLSTITSLAISGNGTFDISNNHVVINYGAGPDPIASIASLLSTGFNGGTWDGAGGIVSSAIASNPGYGVGYADSADAGNPAGLASGTIEVAFTLLGDANLDKAVNGVDFGILAANFNKGITGWDNGDFNYDNAVNGVDFGSLAANFNKGAASASDLAALEAFAAANGLLADVPEPASLGLLVVGAAGIMARRRRKN